MYKKEFNLEITQVNLRIDLETGKKTVDVILDINDPLDVNEDGTKLTISYCQLRFSYEMPEGSTKSAEEFAVEKLVTQEGIIVV